MDKLDNSVTALDKKIDVKFAELPVHFVTRLEYEATKKEATVTRRWTMGTVVSIVAILVAAWPFG